MARRLVQNFFWDTCIVAALLSEQSNGCDLHSIERYLRDAEQGKCQIHISTVTMAEITPSHIKHRTYTTFDRFMKELEGETWCDLLPAKHSALAARVTFLRRCRPIHPHPDLPGLSSST